MVSLLWDGAQSNEVQCGGRQVERRQVGGGQEVDSGWVAGEGVFLDLVYYVTQVFSYSILNVSVKIVLCLSRNLLFAISYFLFSVFSAKA